MKLLSAIIIAGFFSLTVSASVDGKLELMLGLKTPLERLIKDGLTDPKSFTNMDRDGRTIAAYAARNGRWDAVSALLDAGYNPTEMIPDNQNPHYSHQRGLELMIEAASEGNAEWVEKLLALGVNPDTAGDFKRGFDDALSLALVKKHPEVAEILIQAGAPTTRTYSMQNSKLPPVFHKLGNLTNMGWTDYRPIHLATINRDLEILNLLIAEGAAIDMTNSDGMTAAGLAAADGWLEGFEYLLDHGASRFIRDVDGNMLLHHAKDQPAIRQILLRQKFGLTKTSVPIPGIALLLAIDAENYPLVTELCQNPAALNYVDTNGLTVLDYAAGWDRPRAIKILVNSGLDIDTPGIGGKTALQTAIGTVNEGMAVMLLNMGASLKFEQSMRSGLTLVQEAILGKQFELAKVLIENGANLGTLDTSRWNEAVMTPLSMAANYWRHDLVKLLLDKGADVHEVDQGGYDALYYICKSVGLIEKNGNVRKEGGGEIVELLLSRGLDPNKVYPNGRTPLSLLAYSRNIDGLRALIKGGAKPAPLHDWYFYSANDHAGVEVITLLHQSFGEAYAPLVFWSSKPNREQIMSYVKNGGNPTPDHIAQPLAEAIDAGDYELAYFLLEHEANPNGDDCDTTRPLIALAHNRAHKSDEKVVAMANRLLGLGAELEPFKNGVWKHGPPESPLRAAVRGGQVALAKVFLKAGADATNALKSLEYSADSLDPAVYRELAELLNKNEEKRIIIGPINQI